MVAQQQDWADALSEGQPREAPSRRSLSAGHLGWGAGRGLGLLTVLVTSSSQPYFSGPQCRHLSPGDNDSTHLLVLS